MKRERKEKRSVIRLLIGLAALVMMLAVPEASGTNVQAAEKIKGIDVSQWQGTVDWAKVKADGVEFVMLGLGRYRNGTAIPDPNFKYNIENALAQGIKVGVYLFSEADTVAEAQAEARYVLSQIDGYQISYPVAFDQEYSPLTKLTDKQRTDMTIAFLEIIEEAGYYPMIYASESWFNYQLTMSRLTKYDKWVAKWSGTVTIKPHTMWQYSSTGKIKGISTAVDLNWCYKDYSKIITPRSHAKNVSKESEGWHASGKRYYYVKADGTRAARGWLTVGENKYYIGKSGFRVTGWLKISGKYYYFSPKTGVMKTGWIKLGSKYYYLKNNGVRATGWVTTSDGTYYLQSNGVRKTGWLTLKGKKYLLGTKTGKLLKGWVKYQGKVYYFAQQNGQMRKGWLTFGDKKYYLSSKGVRQTGWKKIKGKWYYFNKKDGVMKANCKVGKYVFDANGVCRNYKK